MKDVLLPIKTFPHNNLESLEHILKVSENLYRMKLVIVDGVYSQDGDTSRINEIYDLVKKYNAFLMVDDVAWCRHPWGNRKRYFGTGWVIG